MASGSFISTGTEILLFIGVELDCECLSGQEGLGLF